jgi:endogenous inhibitor of DNA gyrase (YacG/DUF329 family)
MGDKEKIKRSETTRCRVCGTPLSNGKAALGPFCSERCKMQDLSKWFSENYRIASTPTNGVDEEAEEQ